MQVPQDLTQICAEFPDLKLQFSYQDWATDFLRFYQSQVNYNITKHSISLHTTVYVGKKSSSFTLLNPSVAQLRAKISEAREVIVQLPDDPDFIDLEAQQEKTAETDKTNNIHAVNLETKLDILRYVADAVAPYDFKIFGTFICNRRTNYMVNSNGLCKREINSPIMLELKAVQEDRQVTVLETFGGENFAAFDRDAFTARLVEKVRAATGEIVDVEPGEYEVVLAPRCIGEYLQYLSYGMSDSSLDAKRSFFEGKENTQIFPTNITVIDDPTHPELINFDYDGSGHVYEKTALIENGVFRNFMVHNYYGRKLNMPINGAGGDALVMETGDASRDDMIASIKRGLYVSSLHYMNFINDKETSLTGLTRDGTFLIEDGKITKVVNNLRFTEKISDILCGITAIEDTSYTVPFSSNYGEFGISSVKMPHVKVSGFKISSSTHTI